MLVDTIFDKLGASSSGCVSSDSLRQLMGDDAAVDDLATICDIPPEDMKDLCDITLHNAAKQAGNVSSMIDKECLLKGFGSELGSSGASGRSPQHDVGTWVATRSLEWGSFGVGLRRGGRVVTWLRVLSLGRP